MSTGGRIHVTLYRRLVALLPDAHRSRHGDAQVELFSDLLRTGTSAMTLWLRAGPDLARTFFAAPEGRLGSLGRIGIAGLSLANLGLACLVAVAAVGVAGAPVWVLAVCAAVAAQGAYALAWLWNAGDSRWVRTWLFGAGEVVLFLVGVASLTASAIAQARTGFADPEYAPLTIATVVTLHALVGLALVAADRRAPGRPA